MTNNVSGDIDGELLNGTYLKPYIFITLLGLILRDKLQINTRKILDKTRG
jgi:hypothetical protein